ncbi:MAG TPA: hypothetical protein VIH68_03200, partial [Bacteroidota bacterium]
MGHRRRSAILVIAVAALSHFSCDNNGTIVGPGGNPGNQSNDRITIINDESELDGKVRYYNDKDVPIDPPGGGFAAKGSHAQAFSLTLLAEVLPPSVGGQVLQATSVSLDGNKAVVSYNMRGEQFLGGIQVIDVTGQSNPKLKS